MKAFACALLAPLVSISFAGSAPAQQSNQDKPPVPVAAPGSPPPAPGLMTAKERLGPKWSDEQRVDDCNVPVEKRGRPRPVACTQ